MLEHQKQQPKIRENKLRINLRINYFNLGIIPMD